MFLEKNKGFTLIELLVVIAIISLLSSIVLSSLNSARVKARDVNRKAGIANIITALSMYYSVYGVYPTASYAACGTALNGTDLVSTSLLNNKLISGVPMVPSYSGGCGDFYYAGTWNGDKNIGIHTRLEQVDANCKTPMNWNESGSYCDGYYLRVL